jgi:hypothetical protein
MIVFAAAGCGGRSESDRAESVALDYITHINRGDVYRASDFARACELLTVEARRRAELVRSSCPTGLFSEVRGTDVIMDLPEAGRSEVHGRGATVEIRGSGGASTAVDLRREGGDWRVDQGP